MKLNKAGIDYIIYMEEDLELHLERLAASVLGKSSIDVDLRRSDLENYKICCVEYFRGESDYYPLQVDEEDFYSFDYASIKEKWVIKRAEEKKLQEQQKINHKEQEAKNLEFLEREQLRRLKEKYE